MKRSLRAETVSFCRMMRVNPEHYAGTRGDLTIRLDIRESQEKGHIFTADTEELADAVLELAADKKPDVKDFYVSFVNYEGISTHESFRTMKEAKHRVKTVLREWVKDLDRLEGSNGTRWDELRANCEFVISAREYDFVNERYTGGWIHDYWYCLSPAECRETGWQPFDIRNGGT